VQLVAHLPFEQSMPAGQLPAIGPQLTLPPHPFAAVPQLRVPQAVAASTGVQPHTLATGGVPPPHVCGAVQLPQLKLLPHPSGTASQFLPAHAAAIVFGVQPHTLADVPPPQVWGATHLSAHATVCPQLLTTLPHFTPHVCSSASGRQPQIPVMPPPPQVAPVPAQVVGHITVRLQLFGVGPHLPAMQVTDIGSSVHALHMPVAALQPNGQVMSERHWPSAPQVSAAAPLQRCAPGAQTPPQRPVIASQMFGQDVAAP
jgi:hypothetical protein